MKKGFSLICASTKQWEAMVKTRAAKPDNEVPYMEPKQGNKNLPHNTPQLVSDLHPWHMVAYVHQYVQ